MSETPTATDGSPESKKPNGRMLWVGVGVGFSLLALAWTAMFFFASKYRAETVPLETQKQEAKP